MRGVFLGNLLGLGAWPSLSAATSATRSKILIKSAWGSADPTQASFPFHHGNAFAEAGHEVRIFLLGEVRTPRSRIHRSSSGSCSGRTRS
jgi:hypothetical protein